MNLMVGLGIRFCGSRKHKLWTDEKPGLHSVVKAGLGAKHPSDKAPPGLVYQGCILPPGPTGAPREWRSDDG